MKHTRNKLLSLSLYPVELERLQTIANKEKVSTHDYIRHLIQKDINGTKHEQRISL